MANSLATFPNFIAYFAGGCRLTAMDEKKRSQLVLLCLGGVPAAAVLGAAHAGS